MAAALALVFLGLSHRGFKHGFPPTSNTTNTFTNNERSTAGLLKFIALQDALPKARRVITLQRFTLYRLAFCTRSFPCNFTIKQVTLRRSDSVDHRPLDTLRSLRSFRREVFFSARSKWTKSLPSLSNQRPLAASIGCRGSTGTSRSHSCSGCLKRVILTSSDPRATLPTLQTIE